MMHPAFIDGYRQSPTFSISFTVPSKYFVEGMFHFAAGLRARAVAEAIGVALDPELWQLPSSRRSPNRVSGALDWFEPPSRWHLVDRQHEKTVDIDDAVKELRGDTS